VTEESLISGLLPDLQSLARRHASAARDVGLDVMFTAGRRSGREQTELYGHGREFVNGAWVVTAPHLIVTNALPDKAPHCRGAAYDLVPRVGGRPNWDRLDLFARLGAIGGGLGLIWGGSWPRFKDLPHYELPDWRTL
jgi:peptidoglycan L-alanyl-D-glutamate endopeptidase CwlK